MLVDANILLYAVDSKSRFHAPSLDWLSTQLRGQSRLGLPWQSLSTFIRVATHPRVFEAALSSAQAWQQIEDWLDSGNAWVPMPGPKHREILGHLVQQYEVQGDLIPDTVLAALAIEHGLAVCSADTDFARFSEIEWYNPVAQ